MQALKNLMLPLIFIGVLSIGVAKSSDRMEVDDYRLIKVDSAISLAKRIVFEGVDPTLNRFRTAANQQSSMLRDSVGGLYISLCDLYNLAQGYQNCYYTRAKWNNFIAEFQEKVVMVQEAMTVNYPRSMELNDGCNNFIEESTDALVADDSVVGSEYIFWLGAHGMPENMFNFKWFLTLKFAAYLDNKLGF